MSTTQIATPVSMEQVVKFLQENLHLESKTTSEYNGCSNDGDLYKDSHTIKLILCGKTISEIYL